jgi:hypothetical protein
VDAAPILAAMVCPMIAARCSCEDVTPAAAPERLARFVADLLAHGATARPRDPLAIRRELKQTEAR